MPRRAAGDFVLYCKDPRPPWPAVICTDSMVPRLVRDNKPEFCAIPILLLRYNQPQVRYARSTDLRIVAELQPAEEDANKAPGLKEAYQCMVDALTDELSLIHWKTVITVTYGEDELLPKETPFEAESDPELEKAIRASLQDRVSRKRPASLEYEDDVEADKKPKKSKKPGTFKRQKTTLAHTPQPLPTPSSSNTETSAEPDAETGAAVTYPAASMANCVRDPSDRVEQTFMVGDEEDDDYGATEALDCWVIGEDSQRIYIPRAAVDSRLHLKHMGIVIPVGKVGRKVTKPSLQTIDAEQFKPVKEFLETGDFHTPIVDADNNPLDEQAAKNKAIEIFAGAWEIAVDLGLDDIMEVITNKSKALRPWPVNDSISLLVAFVYASRAIEGLQFQSDKDMRQLIVEFCKENEKNIAVKVLLEDKDFSELKRDYYLSKLEDANAALEREDEEEDG